MGNGCPFLYASAKPAMQSVTSMTKPECGSSFETILESILLGGDPNGDTQVLISTIDYNECMGTYR